VPGRRRDSVDAENLTQLDAAGEWPHRVASSSCQVRGGGPAYAAGARRVCVRNGRGAIGVGTHCARSAMGVGARRVRVPHELGCPMRMRAQRACMRWPGGYDGCGCAKVFDLGERKLGGRGRRRCRGRGCEVSRCGGVRSAGGTSKGESGRAHVRSGRCGRSKYAAWAFEWMRRGSKRAGWTTPVRGRPSDGRGGRAKWAGEVAFEGQGADEVRAFKVRCARA
jgi:hypothetical protein